MLEVHRLALDGVLEIVPLRREDSRGFFSEVYNRDAFAEVGIDIPFVQDNHSYSARRGVLRGLHYQLAPRAQDKLVRVVRGAVLDVAVDIRRASPTFGQWLAVELSAAKWNMLLVPKGFAHGFISLEDHAEVLYKVSDTYSAVHERSIRYDDPQLAIDWQVPPGGPLLSDKDARAPALASAETFD